MNILVCISKVPDTTSKIAFTDNNTRFDSSNVQYIVNPSDEWYALVRALELKEQLGTGKVSIITVGLAEDDAIIRKALAIGADDAIRINALPADSFFVASQIAEYAKTQDYKLVLTGKETIDYNNAEVGGMVAELLGWEFITPANKLDVESDKVRVESELGGEILVLEAPMPVVISAAKGMADQRIPNMRGIMAARTKPITVVEPFNVAPLVAIQKFEMPPAKAGVKLVDPENMEELVRLLHDEAKVI
ncbi:MAG: electron transfer flavoprotein subunit beta/FixA family protein [Candidatus Competibacteraceae bacterium]|nr:electron transfer flavoprotein subunit beta/FixA family protein [Candidatus Competibacteraceae bacterium]